VALGGTHPGPAGPLYERTTGSGALAAAVIEIDKLYPAAKESLPELAMALSLLSDAISALGDARDSMQKGDVVASDRCVLHFQANLPALFSPRKIGDGYAVIINSLHVAFINQRGLPLSFDQLTTVWRVLRELRNAPFVEFQHALRLVDELEKRGLRVDSPIISELLEDSADDNKDE
jgi:hypothetical protein